MVGVIVFAESSFGLKPSWTFTTLDVPRIETLVLGFGSKTIRHRDGFSLGETWHLARESSTLR
jgi:hypothetical protein